MANDQETKHAMSAEEHVDTPVEEVPAVEEPAVEEEPVEEEEEETERKISVADVRTHPFDARFPNTNQTYNCYRNYVDYFKCVESKGEDYAPCKTFKFGYSSLCPTAWTDQWDERREDGVFPGLEAKTEETHH